MGRKDPVIENPSIKREKVITYVTENEIIIKNVPV
jgi:hypothetical protein